MGGARKIFYNAKKLLSGNTGGAKKNFYNAKTIYNAKKIFERRYGGRAKKNFIMLKNF